MTVTDRADGRLSGHQSFPERSYELELPLNPISLLTDVSRSMNTAQQRRVWTFSGALAVCAAVLTFVPSARPLSGHRPSVFWFFALVVAVAVSELLTVSFVFRSDSHTFSFVDIPITIGIAVFGPRSAVAAVAIGLSVSLAAQRHPGIRLVYNVVSGSLTCALSFVVAAVIVPDRPSTATLWIGVASAVVLSSAVSTQLVVAVRSLAAGSFQGDGVLRTAMFGTITSAASASFGALAGTAGSVSPVVAGLSVIPVLLLYGALRLFMNERQERNNVEFLYGTTRVLQESEVLEDGLAEVLDRARTVFRTEYAEVAIRRGHGEWLRVHAGGERAPRPDFLSLEPDRPADGVVQVLTRGDDVSHPLLDGLEARDMMVSWFTMQGGAAVGMLLVADRVGTPLVFDRTAQRQFGAFCAQIVVSLENGELEQSLDRLTEIGKDLHYQANHDSLTGLANRTLLRSHLAERTDETTALVIDLDNFKQVNDSFGHDAGDRVLLHVASVLRAVAGDDGLIARLGGDEFAVVLDANSGGRDPSRTTSLDAATAMAERILEGLGTPVMIEGTPYRARASIGVAMQRGGDLDELLRNADVAMYESKRQGKGRTTSFPANDTVDVTAVGTAPKPVGNGVSLR